MDSWAEEAVRELEVEVKRLELDGEAKRTALERAQSDYEAVTAEQATVRRMLEWARKRLPVQPVQAVLRDSYAVTRIRRPAPLPLPGTTERPTQTDLAMQALKQLGGEASTAQIRERLEQAGYQYDQTQVRSALKYLAKKANSQIEPIGAGEWRLRGETGHPPDEPEIIPAMNGTGGSL